MKYITDQNQFEAWHDILEEWKKVRRMKKLVQELYEQVGGTLFYLLDYARKNDISLPNKDALHRMADKIHYLMDQIEPPKTSDESLQSNKSHESDGNLTAPFIVIYL